MGKPQIHLAAFLIAGPVAHSHALWRHPETRGSFLDPALYTATAHALEEGLFDFLFFADRLAVSEQLTEGRETSFRYGAQDAARLDPVPMLSYLAAQTSRIGLGGTRSTTYFEPNHVARSFATLDHISKGRAAWNIVTSMNDSEGRIFGADQHLAHDLRYDRADEFVEATLALWKSWAPDALIHDKEAGIFADPSRIRPVSYEGKWIRVNGTLNIPPGPQGHPVIIQAGSSGRGRRFGARWAEVIFTIHRQPEEMRRFRKSVHEEMRLAGRQPEDCKILTAVMPFIGATRAEAEDKLRFHNSLARPELGLVTLSGQLNFDLGPYPLDLTVDALLERPEVPAYVREKLPSIHAPHETLGDIGRIWAASIRVPQIADTGAEIAARLAELFESGCCDGFVVTPAFLPGSFSDFAREVVPHLQARGIYRDAYTGTTLREHLNQTRPAN